MNQNNSGEQRTEQAYIDPTMQVIAALADEQWDFRTVDAIAHDTSLQPEHVKKVLGELTLLGVARYPLYDDGSQREFFRLSSRGYKMQEVFNHIRGRVATW